MAVLTSGFAAEKGDQLALADDTQTRTWAEFDERVNRLIHSLRDAGVEAGDTIAVLSGNCNEWFETAFACANAGIVFVPVNWHLVASEIAYILGDSDSKAVIVGHHFVNEMFKALDDERCSAIELALVIGAPSDGRFQNFDDFLAAGSPEEPENQSFGGPMFYTSGTTGHPKGVRGSLTNMPEGADPTIWQLIGAGFAEQMGGPGRTVLCGPFYHSAQWAYSFLPMLTGSATVMQHKYDSAGVLRLIDDHQATNIHLVPTQMKRLVDLPNDVKDSFDGSSLRLVLHGAAPCPPAVKQSMIDWWGPKISEYYGSTEGSVITMIDSEEWMAKGGSVGKALDNMEILVVGDDGSRLGPNESGTLYFRNAMGSDFEYHNAPEKTADSHLEPGVFTTGDVGYLDDDGYLFIVDRIKDMILCGGYNVYPRVIEEALYEHPAVVEAVVIGVPDAHRGQAPKAFVVLSEPGSVTGADLRDFLRDKISKIELPREVQIRDSLPKTLIGKLSKKELVEEEMAKAAR